MAESVIASAAWGIFTELVSLTTQQINLAWGFKKDLENLRKKLTYVQALLHDAEGKRIQSELLKEWIKSLKAGACRAENVLDKMAYEHLRRQTEGQKPFTDLARNSAFHLKMAKKVNGVIVLLNDICEDANKISLTANQITNTSCKPRVFKPTVPYLDKSDVVGRQGDMSAVIQMLLGSEEEDKLSVVAVQGMGGLGKTTLAQLVFKDEEVVKNFGDKRTWICVSDDFSVERILKEMAQRFGVDTPNSQRMVEKLKEDHLGGKKYLLVLDDVWNENQQEWVRLRDSLIGIGGSEGSKVLVTTRSMNVVATMQISSSMTHHLNVLSDDDCWAMFEKRVFFEGGPTRSQSLEDIGRRMVQKCKGVPLAVKSLAGLLYTKMSRNEWESIDESEMWHSLASENSILPVLRLSYDHLPTPSLKRCFAYCAVFPKDANIDKDELIRHWMGLGYLHPFAKRALKMEDLGNEYFNILLRSSFLQEPKLDKLGNITSCKMHDLVHDLALDVAEGSILTSKASDIKSHPDVQHLSLHLEEETSLGIQQDNVGNVRTLLLTGHPPKNFDAAKCVRILHLREDVPEYYLKHLNSEWEHAWEQYGYKCHFKELPRLMRKFIHLRYLDLSYTRIGTLPNFVTSFYNLETLVLPSSLQHLPKDFYKLVGLRHLCMDESTISPTVIPAKLELMTSLQTLPPFFVGEDGGHKIEELGSLKRLRGRLRVNNLMLVNDGEEAKKANIGSKKDIQELVFHFGLERSHTNHVDVLEGLQPHKNLKCLKLEEFGGKMFASWMTRANLEFLQNLVKVELRSCQACEQVPTLGHLPHLEEVLMAGFDELKHIGPEFYGLEAFRKEVFPALRKLTLRDMRKLEEWSDVSSLLPTATSEKKFFPRLEEVIIFGCPLLVILPGQLLSAQFQSTCISKLRFCGGDFAADKPSLEIVGVGNSKNNAPLLENLLGKCRSLRNLDIYGLEGLRCLPKQLLNLTSLEKLRIGGCSDLIYVIDETEVMISTGLPSLQSLEIWNCPQLRCLPMGLLQPNLTEFHITNCESLECDESCSLTSLKKMTIRGCPRLGSFWEKGLACLTSLQRLWIGGFSKEVHFPWPSYPPEQCPFSSLESLSLWAWESLTCLPNLGNLTALKDLRFVDFPKLEAIPEWVGDLSSLQSLWIERCTNLKSLPSRKAIQRLAKLQSLTLQYCPILEEQLQQESGEERHNIALIPLVEILRRNGKCRYRYSQKELDH